MNDDYVVCSVCGKKAGVINHLHLRSHKMTTKEYVEKFPDAQLSSKSTIEKRVKKLKGKPRSEETKKKLSESIKLSWQNNPNQGRTGHALSDKSKKALSKKLMGHEVSDETRKKIGLAGIGRVPWNKGLTKYDDERIMGVSKKISEWNKTFMTDEIKNKISQSLKKRYADGMKIPNSKIGTRKDLGMSFRSRWEANYARILKFNDKDIDYENDRYTLYEDDGSIANVYTPDFKIGEKCHIEVKGHADAYDEWGCTCKRCIRDKDKMSMMRAQYSDVEIILIGRKEYRELSKKYNHLVDNWEFSNWDKPNLTWKKNT
jgi:hypothetical protein